MIRGESVIVTTKTVTDHDPKGNDIFTTEVRTVEDVLVGPGPRADLAYTERPEGVLVAFNLHFPKTFTGSLRGAEIEIRGNPGFNVIGDPQPYTLANTPTRWNMPVEVERADG